MRPHIFWEKITKTNTCWTWTGDKCPFGYGRKRNPMLGERLVHRISWILHYGPIPVGMNVLHHCDNPPCCRPDHLFLGTLQDNAIDAENKGRLYHPLGEAHGMAVLKENDVRFIKSSKLGSRTLAKMFAVGRTTITHIRKNDTWKHIV